MRNIRTLYIILFFLCIFLPQASAEEILSWGDCLAEAKKNNPDLISAAEGIKQKEAGKTITASDLYPQISGSMDASTSETSTATTSTTTDSYSYGLSGTQLIFDGFKTIHDIKAAGEDVKASQQNYRFTSSEVRLGLRNAFVNLLKVQELIRVAEEIVKIRRDSLELITLCYYSGLEHKGALLTAEANLAQANFELAQAERDVEFYQRQLTQQMGRKEFKPIEVKGDFLVRDTAKEKPNFEELVKNNPLVLQAALKKNSAAFSIMSTYGNFAPKLSGSASTSKKSSQWPPENEQWNLGLGLTMPIFEGGLKFAQLAQARSVYNQATADERSIRDTAIVSLEQTWAVLQDTIETVDVKRKSLNATQERLKIAEAQYSTGFIDFNNWIIIQNDLVRAKKAYLQAQANALLAEASWIQAKGETLEYAQK